MNPDKVASQEDAAFRIMTQVDTYMSKKWREILSLIKQMKRSKVRLTHRQVRLMDGMRRAVGLSSLTKAMLSTAVAALATLGVIIGLLLVSVGSVQEKIEQYDVPAPAPGLQAPPYLDLRLQRFTVPYGSGGVPVTRCRTFPMNYSADVHITAFEARSLGYPFGNPNAADKIVRNLDLFVVDHAANVTGDPGDGGSFACQWNAPAGAGASRMLWHWSRKTPTSLWSLPQDVGVRLPAVSKILLQVTYDVETGSPDLSSLSSYEFWQEFQPFDESGIRLTLAAQLRPYTAAVLDIGTFAFAVPPGKFTTINHTCAFTDEAGLFEPNSNLNVVALSTRTGDTRTTQNTVTLSVERPGQVTPTWVSTADTSLPAHDALNYQFSDLNPLLPLILQYGDKLHTTCEYNALHGISQTLPAGWGMNEELCLVHLYVWPAEAIRHPYCVSYGGETDSFSC
eukprot:COSAG05_NODE_780_length_7383_cov_123.317408_4_plen_452_part_00